MCGIAGFYGFSNEKLIKECSSLLKHRGPDGEGLYFSENVTLLNRRLAIIDVKGGDQPIYNEDKSVAVVYNGEIYNYLELKNELEKLGHTFTTKSDTEVIAHGYEQWGEAAFDRYNGMFGIALYDAKKKKLILARDHFGIKPVYFFHDKKDGKLLFSSELKPILSSGLLQAQPDDRTIYRYLKFRVHDDGRDTFFKDIKRLLPGEMLIIGQSGMEIRQFSQLKERLLALADRENKEIYNSDYITRFRALLTDSIRRRLVSEVPVGTCLSGGLDSSTVVASVNLLLKEKRKETDSIGSEQKTFSAVFPGSANDEERYIDALLNTCEHIKSFKIFPKAEEFFQDLRDFVKTQEEPTISTGPYAQYQVMKRAHREVTVLLDGQGADEMMAGYLPYYFIYLRQLMRRGRYANLLREVFSSLDVVTKYAMLKIKREKSADFTLLLNHEFAETHRNERFHTQNENIKKRLIEDIFHNSLQSLLRYEDRNAMRFSIEGRVPFLDFRLVEELFKMPDQAIIEAGWNKSILRKAFSDILPPSISKRRNKIGFTTPEYEWFRKHSDVILSFFTGEQFLSKRYINQAQIVALFKNFIEGGNSDTMLFWRVLNMELWLREFIVPQAQKSKTRQNKPIVNPVTVDGISYSRITVKTDLFRAGDNAPEKITNELKKATHLIDLGSSWFAVVSEKAIAVSQGRSYFVWDIVPTFWATFLSRFVRRVPWGIGLGSPWTMELAIREVGLPRILGATLLSALSKPLGMRGVFYKVAGRSAAGIDGPTEYSLYPANVSAKLLPKEPENVCRQIDQKVKATKSLPGGYIGSVIIDANDIGRNVLGNTTGLDNGTIEELFKDNPMGQSDEQTPLTIVLYKT